MEKRQWVKVDADTLDATSKEWGNLLSEQEHISPDKYFSTLSYFSEIIQNKIQFSSEDKHYCFGYVNDKKQAKVLLHFVHARAKATEGGWLKVLSTRISPALDPQLEKNEQLDDAEYAQLLDDTSTLASESLYCGIEFARGKQLTKVKYYGGNQTDLTLLRSLVADINKSQAAKQLSITADRKGQWIEVNL